MLSSPYKLNRGLSLVELMVALLIGLILIAGVTQIYMASRQSQRMTENLSRMQENARFAMATLTRDIRMAGFMPCPLTDNFANVLNAATTSTLTDFASGAVRGYAGTDNTFPGASFPASASSDRVKGTEAILIRRGGNTTYGVNTHQPSASAASLFLNTLHDLEDGDLALVCDTQQASLFQITNANATNVTVVHNKGGAVSPGNRVKKLGSPIPSGYTYGDDAMLVEFQTLGYYIGISRSGTTTSLYQLRTVTDSSGNLNTERRELVEDVENLQALYGVDDNGNGVPQRFIKANEVANWNNVVAVRLGLLLRTPDAVASADDNDVYLVSETPIGTSGTVSHPSDRHLRYAFNTTIKIRNRGL